VLIGDLDTKILCGLIQVYLVLDDMWLMYKIINLKLWLTMKNQDR
jgi:hypothetical protein